MSIGKSPFELSAKLGYEFNDITHLQNAITHSSYANERRYKGIVYPSNERLEFLGDAVLQIVISEYIYERFSDKGEGNLTKMRQGIVCEKTLAIIAKKLSLGEYLNVGHGEEITDCRNRPKILADALEAVIAAIYIDSDKFSKNGSKSAILKLFLPFMETKSTQNADYKTLLQQLVEKDGASVLEYSVISEQGPEHDKLFTVQAIVNNNVVGEGTSSTKKDAEQQAAKVALKLFGVI